jgi:hypothetical protein
MESGVKIPCEICLVRATCRKQGSISVTCIALFDNIIFNEDNNITEKLKKIDEVFNIKNEHSWRDVFNLPNNTVVINRESKNSYIVYSFDDEGYRVLNIVNAFKPNIPCLKRVDYQRWTRIFKETWWAP